MYITLNVSADNDHHFYVDFCDEDHSIEKIEQFLSGDL